MGMFDTFVGKCPNCGADYECQTKQFDCLTYNFEVGAKIASDSTNMRLGLKWPCNACQCEPVALIEKGRFVGLLKEGADKKEGCWGWIE